MEKYQDIEIQSWAKTISVKLVATVQIKAQFWLNGKVITTQGTSATFNFDPKKQFRVVVRPLSSQPWEAKFLFFPPNELVSFSSGRIEGEQTYEQTFRLIKKEI